MSKILSILVVFVALLAVGCAQPATNAWHQRIATVPTTQPKDAIDPETGEVRAISDTDHVPAWAHREALIHHDRIKADVIRAERSGVPLLARETLEG